MLHEKSVLTIFNYQREISKWQALFFLKELVAFGRSKLTKAFSTSHKNQMRKYKKNATGQIATLVPNPTAFAFVPWVYLFATKVWLKSCKSESSENLLKS